MQLAWLRVQFAVTAVRASGDEKVQRRLCTSLKMDRGELWAHGGEARNVLRAQLGQCRVLQCRLVVLLCVLAKGRSQQKYLTIAFPSSQPPPFSMVYRNVIDRVDCWELFSAEH